MATLSTLRCLARATPFTLPTRPRQILPPAALILPATAPFSTSTPVAAAVGKHLVKGKMKKNYKKKNQQLTRARKPDPGVRKAFRKRIQLSNNTALPVDHLKPITADLMTSSDSAGKVFRIPDDVVDKLRALEAFKPTQCWGMFRRPHTMLRGESLEMLEKMRNAAETKKPLRMVITGDRITGKSTMLLHAMAYGFSKKWVLIHLPEGLDLTNGNTEYARVSDTLPMRFSQPVYTMKLLQSILRANRDVLKTILVSGDYSKITHLSHLAPGKSTLEDLAESCKESEFAWPTFEALWKELTTVPGRPPVVFSLDGIDPVMKLSEYRDPSFNPIHAHDLTLIRTFVDALAGTIPLVNGGAVLGTAGGNQRMKIPSLDLVLSQLRAGRAGTEIPLPNAYERGYDDRVYESLRTVEVLPLAGSTREEVRAIMEYWAASGVFRSAVTEGEVVEKWVLSGRGVLGEVARSTLINFRM